VVLAKWLASQSRILIFDEPTSGIDVGAKVEVYNLMNSLVENGAAVIMVSSEMPELIGMSDRILVMHEEMALGALNAAKAAGKTLVIVGFDASPDALTSIQAGELSGSIAQFPTKIGELGVLTAAKVARGQPVDAFVNTGVDVVTKDNVANLN
jgi:ABC-type multidrug transport system ATPase subunit